MIRLRFLVLPLLVVGCAANEAESETKDESALIAAQVAPADVLPSVLHIQGSCTASRIGENLMLIASHCVRTPTGDVRPQFAPGIALPVTRRGASPGVVTLTVVKTTLHPRIEYVCRTQGCEAHITDRHDSPDVAVIEFSGPLDGVPIAQIEVVPHSVGTEVTLAGYGCKTNIWYPDQDGALRAGDTKLIAPSAAVHPGYGITADEVEMVGGVHVVTAGPSAPTAPGPGLCPGDSGGAMFLKGTDRVLGTAASYTFAPGNYVPVTNWHARTDGAVKWGIAAWLEQMGARLSEPCTPDLCQPVRDH